MMYKKFVSIINFLHNIFKYIIRSPSKSEKNCRNCNTNYRLDEYYLINDNIETDNDIEVVDEVF